MKEYIENDESMDQLMDRREFLRTLARYTVLAGMMVIGGRLVTRKTGANGDCRLQTACRICPTLPTCGQSKAVDYRALLQRRR